MNYYCSSGTARACVAHVVISVEGSAVVPIFSKSQHMPIAKVATSTEQARDQCKCIETAAAVTYRPFEANTTPFGCSSRRVTLLQKVFGQQTVPPSSDYGCWSHCFSPLGVDGDSATVLDIYGRVGD